MVETRLRNLDVILSILFGISIFLFLNSIVGSILHIPATVQTINKGLDGEIKVCPPEMIREDVEYAVGEWNRAITYFGLRYMWLDVLGKRFKISSDECDVVFKFVKLEDLGRRECVVENDRIAVSVTNFQDGKAVIYLWRGLIGQDLRDVLRRVIIHEFSWVLGIHPPIASVETASDWFGSLKVTSLDIYALHSKSSEESQTSRIKLFKLDVPDNIPYLTVEKALTYDLLIASVSALLSTILYKLLRWVKP